MPIELLEQIETVPEVVDYSLQLVEILSKQAESINILTDIKTILFLILSVSMIFLFVNLMKWRFRSNGFSD